MKTLLIAGICLLPFFASAQSYVAPPFKGCNTIIVTLPDTPSLRQVAGLLMDSGYAVATANESIGIVSSAPQPFPKNRNLWNMSVSARIVGRRVEWTGVCETGITPNLFLGVVANRNIQKAAYAPGSPVLRDAFNYVLSIAKKTGGEISYEIR